MRIHIENVFILILHVHWYIGTTLDERFLHIDNLTRNNTKAVKKIP